MTFHSFSGAVLQYVAGEPGKSQKCSQVYAVLVLGNWRIGRAGTIEMNILLYWAKLYSWMCAISQFDHSCLCCSWEKWCEWSWELVEWCAGCHGRWHCAYHCHRNHHGHYVSQDMTLRHTRITLPCIKAMKWRNALHCRTRSVGHQNRR